MEFEGKLPGHRHGVVGAELPYVVRRGDVVDLPEIPLDVGRLVLGTAEGEKQRGRAPRADRAAQLALPGEPVLLRTADGLKHGGQIGFKAFVASRHPVQQCTDRHGPAPGRFQQVVNTRRDLAQLLLPEEVKDILGVFPVARVFVEQPGLDVLAV